MTQPSTSRNTRQSGLRRPALLLAFGAATAATALAPMASMAAAPATPTNNDSTKSLGSATDKKPALIAAGILTAMPATPMPAIVTGTINGDINKQALDAANASATVKPKYTILVSKYNLWKAARTPVVTAYLAYKAAPAAQKAAKLKVYNTKLAAFNKAGGAAKYAAYKTAFTAYNAKFTPAYATAKNTVKANHFKLIAGTYGGDATTAPNLCTSAIDMTAQEVHDAEVLAGVTPFIGGNDGDPADSNKIIRCHTGRIEYYLKGGSTSNGPAVWEYFNASITVSGGKIQSIGSASDAPERSDSATQYTPYITNFISLPAAHSTTIWTLASIPVAKKSDFGTYAITILNKSGAFDPQVTGAPYNANGAPTAGKTCVSATTGATLTCLSFQYSLQQAITAALR